MERYSIILEKTKTGYSVFSPDVDGCAATGKTEEEAINLYKEALEFHLEGLKEDGIPIPKSKTKVDYIAIAV